MVLEGGQARCDEVHQLRAEAPLEILRVVCSAGGALAAALHEARADRAHDGHEGQEGKGLLHAWDG